MEHLSVPSLLGVWSHYISNRVLHMGSRAHWCCSAICIAGIALSGCQSTNATGNLSTGEFTVTSFRLFTDTGLGVVGPKGSGINLTSSPNAHLTAQLIDALVAVSAARIPPRLRATDIGADE